MIPTSAPAGRGRMNGVPLPFGPRAPSSLRRHHDVKPRPPARPSTATATPRQAKSPAREITITLSAMSCAATTTMPRRRRSDAPASSETTPAGGGDATTTTGGSSDRRSVQARARPTPTDASPAAVTATDVTARPAKVDGGDGNRYGALASAGSLPSSWRVRSTTAPAASCSPPAPACASTIALNLPRRRAAPASSLLLASPEERVDVGDVLGAREGAALGLGVIDGRGEGAAAKTS